MGEGDKEGMGNGEDKGSEHQHNVCDCGNITASLSHCDGMYESYCSVTQ